jgi:beta-glucuronidase
MRHPYLMIGHPSMVESVQMAMLVNDTNDPYPRTATRMLTPIDNAHRDQRSLDGLWSFVCDHAGDGEARGWHRERLPSGQVMPVPASWNDLTQDPDLRDHVGAVWYQRQVQVPAGWSDDTVGLWIGAAGNHATVWWDGQEVARHRGAFLPFATELPSTRCSADEPHLLTIRIDNRLDFSDLPTGRVIRAGQKRPGYEGERVQLESFHDFFNYAGIHRSVRLVREPRLRIERLALRGDLDAGVGVVRYIVAGPGAAALRLEVRDEAGTLVAACEHHGDAASGELRLPGARPWQPGAAYRYRVEAAALDAGGIVRDRYHRLLGLRRIVVGHDGFLINGQPFYFRGVGKHEDSPLHGRGHDPVVLIKDLGLLEWMGANSFRTSHYPYDESWLDEADRRGLVVIGEVPAVGFNPWNRDEHWFADGKVDRRTLANHIADLEALVERDGHHACIVAWNLLVEAPTHEPGALAYCTPLVAAARAADPSRPLTFEQSSDPERCQVQQLVDFVCMSRYYGWYENLGDLAPEVLCRCLLHELDGWRARFGQPVLMLEFGADCVAGLHADPPVMFSEEYQAEVLRLTCETLDTRPWVIGEHVWNFADFMTKQGLNRVVGNRKGVFTRERQPKMGAHYLRSRWRGLGAAARPQGAQP